MSTLLKPFLASRTLVSLASSLTSLTFLSLHWELCFLYRDHPPELQLLPSPNIDYSLLSSFSFFKIQPKYHLHCKACSWGTLFTIITTYCTYCTSDCPCKQEAFWGQKSCIIHFVSTVPDTSTDTIFPCCRKEKMVGQWYLLQKILIS